MKDKNQNYELTCYLKSEEDHLISIKQLSWYLLIQMHTTQYRIKQLSQSICVHFLLHSNLLGLFNFTFNIPILCLLTYALAMHLIIVHTLYISTYHNSHALVHISTCTCTFKCAHVHPYQLTPLPNTLDLVVHTGNVSFIGVSPNGPH